MRVRQKTASPFAWHTYDPLVNSGEITSFFSAGRFPDGGGSPRSSNLFSHTHLAILALNQRLYACEKFFLNRSGIVLRSTAAGSSLDLARNVPVWHHNHHWFNL